MKLVIEPSGAAALAALLHRPDSGLAGKRVGAIVSGGNIDPARYAELIRRRLSRAYIALLAVDVTARDVFAEIGRALVNVDCVRLRQQLIDRNALDDRRRAAVDDVGQRVNDAAQSRCTFRSECASAAPSAGAPLSAIDDLARRRPLASVLRFRFHPNRSAVAAVMVSVDVRRADR